jgi:hypothetical protein
MAESSKRLRLLAWALRNDKPAQFEGGVGLESGNIFAISVENTEYFKVLS